MESLLTDTRARISTEGLAPIESLQFVVTHLLHYVCRRRETAPLTEPPTLHTLILIEEAQTLLQKNGENIAYYQELLLRARALGVGFVFVCQDISRIDPIILAACSNLFVFGQASTDDKTTCQKVLDLSARETGLLGELPVGEAFIRFIGHPAFPWAFHGRIPDVRLT
jgi:DNA helicase HerA-like ATPase